MKGARRPILREKSATKESIILGGLGATIPDSENAQKSAQISRWRENIR
jgi:hypothetical protein